MMQASNIYASVRAKWLSHVTLPALVPGGLLVGLRPAPVSRPFASMQVAIDGEPEGNSGNVYVQRYGLTIGVWGGELISTAGAIQYAMETLLPVNYKLPLLTNGAWTLNISPEPGAIDESAERFYGKFNFVASGKWTITLQEGKV